MLTLRDGTAIAVVSTFDEPVLRSSVYVFIILLAGEIFQIGIFCFTFGARLAITEPLTVTPWGLVLQTQQGTVRLPWEAVVRVRSTRVLLQPGLAFIVHPRAVPGQRGVEGEAAHWRRYTTKGVLLGASGLRTDTRGILAAVRAHSHVPIE